MDWARAITRNSEALKGIIEALFAMLGLAGEATRLRIPRPLHTAVLRILRPAESAVRRLIVIAARGLVVKPSPSRPMPAGKIIIGRGGNSGAAFQLFDPRKNFTRRRRRVFARIGPRIHVFGSETWMAPLPQPQPAPPPDNLVDAARLTRRLEALKLALEDLPRQAKRLARWRMKREKAKAPKFISPLRPGRAPGHRRKPDHKIDDVLAECQWLAFEAMRSDTS